MWGTEVSGVLLLSSKLCGRTTDPSLGSVKKCHSCWIFVDERRYVKRIFWKMQEHDFFGVVGGWCFNIYVLQLFFYVTSPVESWIVPGIASACQGIVTCYSCWSWSQSNCVHLSITASGIFLRREPQNSADEYKKKTIKDSKIPVVSSFWAFYLSCGVWDWCVGQRLLSCLA